MMDKLRPLINWLVRNRFWVTCVLVTIASIATWFMAWSTVEKKREDRARVLNSKKSSIEGVLATAVKTGVGENELPLHPNDSTKRGMQQRIEEAAKSALAAWEVRYQKQQDLLKISEVLPGHIRNALVDHKPMEKPLESELLSETQRDTFRKSISKQMPLIAKKIQTRWTYNEKGEKLDDLAVENRGSSSADPKAETPTDLVRWDKDNQELWNSKTTEFVGFNRNFDTAGRPTTQQALALQQDLWILEGIFDAVSEVNKGFTANDLAPIEKIDHVLVGIDAVNKNLGKLAEFNYVPPSTSSSSGSKGKIGGGVTSKAQARNKGAKGNLRKAKSKRKGSVYNPGASSSPFHGRYVDRDYSQLNESDITNAITSDKLTNQSYLAVAKRVPVRIALKMDERRVNDFLAAAANSPFAFEIRQVRINKHVPGEGVDRKPQGAPTNNKKDKERGSIGLGGGAGGGGNAADGPPSGGGGAGSDADDAFYSERRANFDIKVEFIGIVKIYNPVNESLIFPNKKKSN